ncbi:MAG: pyridoxal phosphate-dependent aminotransferase [Dehalococcoidia bacterium]
MRVAKRMNNLGTEGAFEVLAKAKELEGKGVDVIHLEIGEPDFDTPRSIREAAINALNQGYTHYGPAAGLPELRSKIAEHVSSTRGIQVDSDRVVISPGAKPIMNFTLTALIEEGDEVIYPNPGFPIYESMINFVGGTPVPMQLYEERGFLPDLDELERLVSPKTRLIIINSPHNPTGSVLDRSALEAIADIAIERDLIVLTDEIYRDILYEGSYFSIASLPGMAERSIILDGFSKTYAMTGWRLGYGVLPKELVPHFSRLMVNSVSCTASFVQRAGLAALDGRLEETDHMIEEFRRRRDSSVRALNDIEGISCLKPKGAFYLFPNIKGTGLSSREFTDRLLYEAGVAVLHGDSFGSYGEGYVRISIASSMENLNRAIQRIEEFLSKKVN